MSITLTIVAANPGEFADKLRGAIGAFYMANGGAAPSPISVPAGPLDSDAQNLTPGNVAAATAEEAKPARRSRRKAAEMTETTEAPAPAEPEKTAAASAPAEPEEIPSSEAEDEEVVIPTFLRKESLKEVTHDALKELGKNLYKKCGDKALPDALAVFKKYGVSKAADVNPGDLDACYDDMLKVYKKHGG